MSDNHPEIGSDSRAAEVEPPATPFVPAGGSADAIGVTGNALLLLGMIAGAMMEHGYIPTEVDAAGGAQVLRNTRTDNTFHITVVQLEGQV